MNEEQLQTYLERHQAQHVERIRQLVAQPCIPSEQVGLAESVDLLGEILAGIGFQEIERIPTPGAPGLWARLDVGAPRTLAVYGMLDTKPYDAARWSVPPLEGRIVDRPGVGRVLVGLGARSRKGPLAAWLNAVEALLAVDGTLPCNLCLLVEAEENNGSPHYKQMFDAYRSRLAAVDACLAPGCSVTAPGRATLTLGFKGLIYGELVAAGEHWGRGPVGRPVHGMAKSVVDAPAWRLAHALASLTDRTGNRVTAPGFYDEWEPPSPEERAEARELVNRFGDRPVQEWLPGLGPQVQRLLAELEAADPEEVLLHYLYQPSFNLNGLRSGYTGPGTPVFTLPDRAGALFDLRLPRGMQTEPVLTALRRHLDDLGYTDIQIDVWSRHEWAQTPRDADLVRVARELLGDGGCDVVLWPFSGGGGPWSLFRRELDVPVLFDFGYGHGGNAGAPDEYLVVAGEGGLPGLVEYEQAFARLLRRWGRL